MPPRRSRRASAVGIDPLVTGCAREGGNAHACLTAHDIETMKVPVVALLRIVRGGVAVDAAGMGYDRIHPPPGGEALGAGGLSVRPWPGRRDQCDLGCPHPENPGG